MIPKEELERGFGELKSYFDNILKKKLGLEEDSLPTPDYKLGVAQEEQAPVQLPEGADFQSPEAQSAEFFRQFAQKMRNADYMPTPKIKRRSKKSIKKTLPDTSSLIRPTTISSELQTQKNYLSTLPENYLKNSSGAQHVEGGLLQNLPSSSSLRIKTSPTKNLKSLGKGGLLPYGSPRVK